MDYIDITTLNRLARQVLEQCEPLQNIVAVGEISNFTRHYKSGHLYFSLKDENAAIKSVMWRTDARLLGFEPQNGMLVMAYGRAAIFERDGTFQLYVNFMRPFGAGAAQMAFDALKKKLEAEGLLDPARKRELPPLPRCIGVVTSKTGAALQDVKQVISRRWPMVRLLLAPVSVQGLEADREIASAIQRLDRDARPDLILITRGGGSKEDLWVFNSERIARAAAACRKPVVSAVGHEIDYTILDYVADVRAPTPSAAAEICVPDQAAFRQKIYSLEQNIQKNIQSRLEICYNEMGHLSAQSILRRQQQLMTAHGEAVQALQHGIYAAMHTKTNTAVRQMQSQAALAAGLNPYAVLARGYAIPSTEEGVPCPVEQLTAGDVFVLRGACAKALCTVNAVCPADPLAVVPQKTVRKARKENVTDEST